MHKLIVVTLQNEAKKMVLPSQILGVGEGGGGEPWGKIPVSPPPTTPLCYAIVYHDNFLVTSC